MNGMRMRGVKDTKSKLKEGKTEANYWTSITGGREHLITMVTAPPPLTVQVHPKWAGWLIDLETRSSYTPQTGLQIMILLPQPP